MNGSSEEDKHFSDELYEIHKKMKNSLRIFIRDMKIEQCNPQKWNYSMEFTISTSLRHLYWMTKYNNMTRELFRKHEKIMRNKITPPEEKKITFNKLVETVNHTLGPNILVLFKEPLASEDEQRRKRMYFHNCKIQKRSIRKKIKQD